MKMTTKTLGAILAMSLLFSGVVVIAGGIIGASDGNPMPIHRGEACRDAMMENLGMPEEEIGQLAREAALAGA